MSEVKLALTPADWADWCAEVERSYEYAHKYLRRSMFDDHGTAALLLHGQPFGFTWEDVDTLRYEAESEWLGVSSPNPGDILSSIADRIGALLPPRELEEG